MNAGPLPRILGSLTISLLLLTAPASPAQGVAPDSLWYLESGSILHQVLPGGNVVNSLDLSGGSAMNRGDAYPMSDGTVWLRIDGSPAVFRVDTATGGVLRTGLPLSAPVIGIVESGQTARAVVAANGEIAILGPMGFRLATATVPGKVTDVAIDEAARLWLLRDDPATGAALDWVDLASTGRGSLPLVAPLAGATPDRVRCIPSSPGLPPRTFVRFSGSPSYAVFDGAGNRLADVTPGPAPTALELTLPTTDARDRLWCADSATGEVHVLAPDGASTIQTLTRPGRRILGIDTGPRSRILIRHEDAAAPNGRMILEGIDPASLATTGRTDLPVMEGRDPGRYLAARTILAALDVDGDGVPSDQELAIGSSPFDRQSRPSLDLTVAGIPNPGGSVELRAAAGLLWVAGSTALAPVPQVLLGLAGESRLAIAGGPVYGPWFTIAGSPTKVTIPTTNALLGLPVILQAVEFTGTTGGPAITGLADFVVF